jgi:RNA polymerase-binding transcription factor DksA
VGEVKEKLTQEQVRLQARIAELKAQDPYQNPEHVNDNASTDTDANEEEGHDRVVALLEEMSSQLDAVERALLRLGDGTYGTCSNCGKGIGEDRLRVNPTAEKCMECESLR